MRSIYILILLLIAAPAFAQKGDKAKNTKKEDAATVAAPAQTFTLKDQRDSLGYALGLTVANDLKRQGFDISMEAFMKGMQDASTATPAMMYPNQTQQYIGRCQQDARKAKSQGALDKANKFLAENKTKPGVITLPSGLQYLVLKEGTGAQPTAQSNVTTHYHGTLVDGTVFDSSVERGEPASFPVGGVIRAWQEMLVLMKEGGKVRLFCPPHLAYGEQGAGGKIGPNELLIFEIELIKVN